MNDVEQELSRALHALPEQPPVTIDPERVRDLARRGARRLAVVRGTVAVATLVAGAAVALGIAQGGGQPPAAQRSLHRAVTPGSTPPHAGPPPQPCAFPDAATLRAAAARPGVSTVEATVLGGETTGTRAGHDVITTIRVHVTRVLTGSGATAGRVALVALTGRPVDGVLAPGSRYVLMLTDPAPGSGPFGIADGLYGMFDVTSGRAYLTCPNYADPQHPLSATGAGQGQPIATFEKALTG